MSKGRWNEIGDRLRHLARAWAPRALARALVARGELLEGLRRPFARGEGHLCPICHSGFARFTPVGDPPRPLGACPVCGARARHRLAWLFLQRATDLFDGREKRLLHLAPERCLLPRLARQPGLAYVSADLDCPWAELEVDVTRMPFPDGMFDALLCSHVLEHVPDDRRALAEIARVIRPGGWAMIVVPMVDGPTFEDPAVTTPAERMRRYGHPEHVRSCGADYLARIAAAGLVTRFVRARDLASPEECGRAGIPPAAGVFHGRRP